MRSFSTIYLYITTFFTGAAVLVIEILGTRIIGPFYGTTIFVWTSLITVTLGALALGYFFGGRLVDKRPDHNVFYWLIFLAGISFFLPLKIDQWALVATNSLGFKFGPLVATIILFFIPLLLLGFISPFAIRLVNQNRETTGSVAGRVFALSTVGSIVGGWLSGFYLLDKLSLSQSLSYTGILLIITAFIGLLMLASAAKRVKLLVIIVLISLGVWLIPSYVYSDNYTLQIHHEEQSFYADLKIMEIGGFECLAMNGALQSCVLNPDRLPTFTFIAETKRLAEARQPKNMLLLGLGTGNILKSIPEWLPVDVVEIDEKVVPLAERYFGLTSDDYNSLTIDDARHFLSTNEKKYDLILVDTFLGNVLPQHMVTQEAMQLLARSLTDDGLLLINMEGKLGPEDEQLKTIMKTAKQIFPSVILTATEPDRYTSVLLNVSKKPDYEFVGGGRFILAPIDYQDSVVMTDDFNYIDLISFPKLKIFRGEMETIGGLKLLFSS